MANFLVGFDFSLFTLICLFMFSRNSFQVASRLSVDGYGLVFGWNTFVAVCLQSILTLIVVDKNGFDLPEDKQVSNQNHS